MSHDANTPLTPAVVKIVRKAFWRDPAWLRILYGTRQDFHGFLSLTSEQTEKLIFPISMLLLLHVLDTLQT